MRLAMTDSLTPAVCAALEYLRDLNRDGVRPDEARNRMSGLRGQHPQTRIDLLWEEEACDQSVHYDTLVQQDGEGTVSLSFCRERTLPWPLRGVQRWSEMDLVRVNATVLKVDQAVALLDFIWDDAPMLKRLVDAGLIREALDQDPVPPSDEDLQRALDEFRRLHGLFKAADMYRWMEQRGLTQERLESHLAELAEIEALRDRVTARKVEAYFEERRSEFDTVSLAQFTVKDADQAQKIAVQIRAGSVDFYAAAERSFLAEDAPSNLFKTVVRGQASAEFSAAFDASPGELLGPIRVDSGNVIVRVLSQTPARLDTATQAAIKELVFEDWLKDRRRAATIEWYWGPVIPPDEQSAFGTSCPSK
jgi:putative peptide maturation system protein